MPETIPYQHQNEAVSNAEKYFALQSRGKLIMACGTGKTLTCYWIAQSLNCKNIIVFVPNLMLQKQMIQTWKGMAKDYDYICVSSDKTIVHDIAIQHETNIKVTTKESDIITFLSSGNHPKVIFCTYHSSDKLSNASRQIGYEFDFAVFDEAHRTVGQKDGLFGTCLFDKNISIKKRLFTTATEKIYRSKSDSFVSMDEKEVYGDIIYSITTKEAIERKILVDYKLVTIFMSEAEMQPYMDSDGLKDDIEKTAQAIMLLKAAREKGMRHIVTYHNTIRSAKEFKEILITCSEMLSYRTNVYHLNGSMSMEERDRKLKNFRSVNPSIITTAKAMQEGIDIPEIDGIFFADKKKSSIEIVQSSGRAFRIYPGKELSYIMVPTFLKEGEKDDYSNIFNTVSAMATTDERIAASVSASVSTNGNTKSKNDVIEIVGDSGDINFNFVELKKHVYYKCWARFLPFDQAREHVRSLDFKNQIEWTDYAKSGERPSYIPSSPNKVYASEWYSWGNWFGTNYIAPSKRLYRSHEDAVIFARSLKLKNYNAWKKYYNEHSIPTDIPFAPNTVYKGKGWISWEYFIGYSKKIVWRNFLEARQLVRGLGLKDSNDWNAYSRSGKKPDDIPAIPRLYYKEFKGMGDWLGTGKLYNGRFKDTYLSFKDAHHMAIGLCLKSQKEWQEWCNTDNRPSSMPTNPYLTYANEWVSFPNWLGYELHRCYKKDYFWNYQKAAAFVYYLNLKNQTEWDAYRTGEKPRGLPSYPQRKYLGSGWKGWKVFLGTEKGMKKPKREIVEPWEFETITKDKPKVKRTKRIKRRKEPKTKYKPLPFQVAKTFIQKLCFKDEQGWYDHWDKNRKPVNLPLYPDIVYKDSGWVSWAKWLGTEKQQQNT